MTEKAADSLIKAHDGNMALLYIFVSRTGCVDDEKAASELCMTLSDVKVAKEKLLRAGLFPEGSCPKSESAISDVPSYSADDVKAIAGADANFKAVLDEAESVYQRPLSSAEMKQLCMIYSQYGLSAEVLFVLLHYCSDISSENSRRLTTNFIDKQALRWVEQGIDTAEAAEEYSEQQKELRTSVGKVKAALDIQGRNLSSREEEYVLSWLGMGFDADSIYEAYDLTLVKTGKREWKYMNAILRNWNENGKDSDGNKNPKNERKTKINIKDTIKILDKV